MSKILIKTRARSFKLLAGRRLETGFSMLEAVVVVGVLLALAVSGFIAYGTVTENAKVAAVKSAASQVHTAVMVANLDGDPVTTSTTVMDDWNNSNDRIKVRIVGDTVEIAAMTTGEVIPTEPDVCVEAKYVESTDISALSGSCDPVVPVVDPAPTETPTATPSPTPPPAPVTPTGYVASWGSNVKNELGNGSATMSLVPTESLNKGLLAGKKISAVSAGAEHSCGISEGKAYCWGNNRYGQLGNGATNTTAGWPVAVNAAGVLAGKTVTALAGGWAHTCAIADGQAYCWGYNVNGELGNKSFTDSSVPVKVDTSGALAGKTITGIYAENNNTCAIADGSAFCWGLNKYGQLGNNSIVSSSIPVAVDTSGLLAGKQIASISQGQNHTCALTDGTVYCWGSNYNNELGNTVKNQSLVPSAVDNTGLAGKTITSITSGNNYNCEIADGALYCWGTDFQGGMGNKLTKAAVPTPVDTSGALAGKTVTAVDASGYNTCAVANNAVYCWGANNYGQLGNNTPAGSSSPVPVAVKTDGILGGKTIMSLSVGAGHVAALYS